MDSKAQHFVHFDIYVCEKFDLTHYYYRLFLFIAKGILFAMELFTRLIGGFYEKTNYYSFMYVGPLRIGKVSDYGM